MTLEEFAERVEARQTNDAPGVDPLTIAAIVAALVKIGRLIYACVAEGDKDGVLAMYNARGPLGWFRRRRVRSILAEHGLDGYQPDLLAEAEELSQAEFTKLFYTARSKDWDNTHVDV